jgi:C_GCAxxG_C_C family probable redox protein
MTHADRAVEKFRQGYNCSQAVVTAFAEDYGVNEETAALVARGFGGGMGRTGGVCGAVSGAVMVIGLSTREITDTDQAKQQAYALVREFFRRFRERRPSLQCRDLLGYDIGDPEMYVLAKEQNLFEAICAGVIRDAAEVLEEIL